MPSLSRYEVLQPIGDNHFATYHRGFDTTGERDVCIIQFLDKFRRNPDRWEQLWQQVLSAGRLKHDYLVSVYDYDRERGWVISELMQGSLRDLAAEAVNETELVRTVLYRTLETLDYIHSNQFVHGDVRPASLLYDVAGQTKLSFSPGLSLGGQIPRREKDHAFLAPELFDPSFGDIGVGVDLYGCGISALSLLLGQDFSKRLLGSDNSSDIAWQRFHLDESSQPSVRELLPHLPRDMEQVIQKLISKKVTDRFTSIAEARALLTRPEVEVKIQIPNAPPKPAEERRRAVSTADVPMAFREATMPPKSPAKSGKSSEPAYPPWSREWINHKLKNPVVMGSVCGGILLMMILAMVFVSSMQPKKMVAVSVKSLPAGASIFIDDERFDAQTDAEINVPAGEHQLKLELPGYELHTQTIEVPASETAFALPVVSLLSAKIPEPVTTVDSTKSNSERDNPEPPKASTWQLPAGLAAVGDDTDKATRLPLRVKAASLTDNLQNNDVPLTLVLIPAGEYSLDAVEPLQTGELKSRTVTFDVPFYIGQYEVTRAQWQTFQQAKNPDKGEPIDDERRNHPAVYIAFDATTEFCEWLGESFAVPTEDEWEAVARGIDGRLFPWGGEKPSAQHLHMRAFATRGLAGAPRTVAVDGLPDGTSPNGVHHLLGNVAEWCRDVYRPGYDETDETAGAGKLHVIRGGSFRSPASGAVRITWRANAPDDGANDVGLRVVCHLKPPQK